MGFSLPQLVDGLSLGTIFGLLAVANSLCWRVNRSLILANSGFYVIGVAVCLATIPAAENLGFLAPVALWIGALAAVLSAVVAALCIRIVSTPTADNSPVLSLISSTGLLLIALAALQYVTRQPIPVVLTPATAPRLVFILPVLDVTIPAVQAVIVVAGALCLWGIWQLFALTRFGRAQRAALEDPQMAGLFGIDLRRINIVCLLIFAAVSSCAGAMAGMDGHAIGTNGVLLSAVTGFASAAVAGLRTIPRSAVGGIIAGGAVALWTDYISPNYGELAVLAAIFVLLIVRPAKLYSTSEQF